MRLIDNRRQGAQERLVPATKGPVPEAPAGGHISHDGTLLEAVPVGPAAPPPELAAELEPARPTPDELGVVLGPPPPEGVTVRVAPVLEVDPVAVLPVVVVDVAVLPVVVVDVAVLPVVAVDVEGAGVAKLGLAPLVAAAKPPVVFPAVFPSVTTPLFVALGGVTAVCAKACPAIAAESSPR